MFQYLSLEANVPRFFSRGELVTLVVTTMVVGVTACTNPEAPTIPPKAKLRFSAGCDMMRPSGDFRVSGQVSLGNGGVLRKDVHDPGDDCPVETYDSDDQFTMVSEPFSSSLPAVRSWDGQNFSMADIEETEASLGTCYDIIDNFRFSRISPEGTIERFLVAGASYKIADLGTVGGINRARYQLPDNYFVSESGRYTAFGGTVDAACVTADWQLRLGPVGLHVNVMAYRTYNYTGHIKVSINGGGGTFASGWAYYDPGQSFASGNSGGWDAALDAYLADGSCTPHWDIFVDGHLVCRDGNRVNQA